MQTLNRLMERFARLTTRWAGSTPAAVCSIALIAAWLVLGPWCRWSDSWQLVANTFTTLVNFVMVFVLQRSINKESVAMQLKLNELIAIQEDADNRLIDVESLTENEVDDLHHRYQLLAKVVKVSHLRGKVSVQALEGATPDKPLGPG